MNTANDLVIVTGSSGLIGYAVSARLAEEGYEVVGFDRQAPSPPPPGCTAVPVDIASEESVREGLRVIRQHHGTRVASVIHLAAYYDFSGEPSPKYEEITVRGTERLLRGLKDFQVEQFVFPARCSSICPSSRASLSTKIRRLSRPGLIRIQKLKPKP